jgi:hypothetical protein
MPVLSGVKTKLFGRQFGGSTIQGPATERLLILGFAQDGPINVPRRVTDVGLASLLWGPASYTAGYWDPNTSSESEADAGTTIPQQIAQAVAAGAQDIWVVRYTGTYATEAAAFGGKLDLRSIYPGRIYNRVALTLATTGGVVEVYLTQPGNKGGTVQLLPNFPASGTVANLIDKINMDSRNRTLRINPRTYPTILSSAAYTALGSGVATLTGGTNGCKARGDDFGPEVATGVAAAATKLLTIDSGTFDTLEGLNFSFDVAVLTGIYADDQIVDSGQTKIGGTGTYSAADCYQTTIARDFEIWLGRMSNDVSPCRGVTAVRPPLARDQSALITYVNSNLLATTHGYYDQTLRWLKMGPFMYEGFRDIDFRTNDTFDGGARLSVVAGPEVVMSHADIGNYTDMWHGLYAAWMTTIPPERAPILKPLPNGVLAYGEPIPRKYADKLISGVGYDPNNQLSGRGAYVCLVKDPADFEGPLVLYSDVTAAWREDYFSQDQLVHLVNRLGADLTIGLRGFLGGPTDIGALSAMRTQAKTILDGYANSGAFRGYEGQGYTFDINIDGVGAVLGIVIVNLEINPATAMRQIRLNITVRNVA